MLVRWPARTLRDPGAPWPGSEKTIRFDQSWEQGAGTVMRDNAFSESFNGKFRAECPNTHWLMNVEARRRT